MSGIQMPTKRNQFIKEAFRYRDALLAYAFAFLRDWDLAEDVVQDAFLVAMDKWQECHDETGVFAWLRQIVQYKALNAHRTRRTEVPAGDAELTLEVTRTLDEQLDTQRAEEHHRTRSALQHCMKTLDGDAIALLTGFYWRRQSCEALALPIRETANAVRLRLSRLRGKLRLCIKKRMLAEERR